ncbi:ras-related protein Rab-21 [Anoplophora glabripennis]|uniref:ras-related protein Rab-21 n=1 Tax=Anoplophora glabripennis TaxID=217634 RepID=UPI000873EC6E|nr:ras-related protein Rab-21 [Anoplophora glabripennis]
MKNKYIMATNTNGVYNFKVVLLGEGCVGKTSLVLRYVEDKFNTSHITTIQASFLNKKINLGGDHINLAIWDTAGQEKFHALGPIYYRSANGAVLVYDITDEDSFQKVKNWVKELRKILGAGICLVIVGNKIDLAKNRHVTLEEAVMYSKKVGAIHFETSAKFNEGVDEMFLTLTEKMLFNYKVKADSSSCDNLNLQKSSISIVDDQSNSTRNCCGSA